MALKKANEVAIQRGLTALFRDGYMKAAPHYPNVCLIRKSDGRDEGYANIGAVPGVREWTGERHFGQLAAGQFTITNKDWEVGVEIEKNDLDDDRIGMYSDIMMDLGEEMAFHPDKARLQLMVDGASTECWDGQYFYDTDHSWRSSGSQTNKVSQAAATGTSPTVEEFKTAVTTAINQMLALKRDNGEFWVRPTVGRLRDLMIEVPLALRDVAITAYEQQIAAEGSIATSNVVIDRPQVVCSPLLGTAGIGSDAVCYLHWLGGRMKPFIFQKRWDRARTDMQGWDDDRVRAVQFMATNRYNFGYLAWMYSQQITFT